MMKRLLVTVLLCSISYFGFAGVMSGKPFFRNFTALEYHGHNRNFAVECDNTGHVFVANFEGLLTYDGVNWEMTHTPAVSRVTTLFKAKDGKVWFGGHNVLGYAVGTADSIHIVFVISDTDKKIDIGEIEHIYERDGKIYFATSDKDYMLSGSSYKPVSFKSTYKDEQTKTISISDNSNLVAATTINKGIVLMKDRQPLFTLTTDDGLCSNNVNDIAYNGKGNLWGVTDNGIFVVSISTIYSHYTEKDGLIGQVTCILNNNGRLMVGTLQGLFVLDDNNRFTRLLPSEQACWNLVKSTDAQTLAATVDGLFIVGQGARQLTSSHTLSVMKETSTSFLTGELDGIYRHGLDGTSKKIAPIQNVMKFKRESNGGIWVLTLNKETYYKAPMKEEFVKTSNDRLSLLLEYMDENGHTWTVSNNGSGLVAKYLDKNQTKWLQPFKNYTIQAMDIKDGIAWLGGIFGLIRFNTNMINTLPYTQNTYLRNLVVDGSNVDFAIATDKSDPIGETKYSYRLHDGSKWSRWSDDQTYNFAHLSSGSYELTVRSLDSYGNISESVKKSFAVPVPLYMKWYAILLYLIVIVFCIYLFFRWRIHRAKQEQVRLEKIVNKRTEELKEAHSKILRQEKEATVGKLTKGLIDRILNPMNYINNFSHMSLDLVSDLKENIEKEENNMTEDAYEDSLDIIDMMNTNLSKIEQHGLSTTRILKAMEELLKERSGKVENINVSDLCEKDIEMLNKYFAEDIQKHGIHVEWQKPTEPMMANVVAEHIGKTILSMLSNSIYALKKKASKETNQAEEGYIPTVRLSISKDEHLHIHVYDNGIGIEENILDKIFDPFFTTKPTAEAPGVGLYLCQQVIQDVGGTIMVKSEKDKFTEFTITL